MQPFNSECEVNVNVTNARIKPYEGQNGKGYILQLEGETEDGFGGWGQLFINEKINTKGLTGCQQTVEILKEAGVPDNGSGHINVILGNLPQKISEGLRLNFSVKYDDQSHQYNKIFVNPPRDYISLDQMSSFVAEGGIDFAGSAMPAFNSGQQKQQGYQANSVSDADVPADSPF